MSTQRVGYIRVSAADQNVDRQLDGVKLDKTFIEKQSGGTRASRKVLQECMDYLREGDVLVVHSIDRLARNLLDLQKIVSALNEKGISVEFKAENLIFSDDPEPMHVLTLQMLGAFAEFERKLIRNRQAEGIQAAKRRGKHIGRQSVLTEDLLKDVEARLGSGMNKSQIARELDLSRNTIYKAISQLKRD